MTWGIPLLIVAAAAVALGGAKKASAQEPEPGPEPDRRPDDGVEIPPSVELSEAMFPPLSIEPEWDRIVRLAGDAERAARIPGLRDYIIAVAYWEARGIPGAYRQGTWKDPILCEDVNYEVRFADNPWLPKPCLTGPTVSRWAYTGGIGGLAPTTALNTSDKRGRRHDPARVFDLPFAMAYEADLVYRLRTKNGAVNFDRVRAGWKYPSWADEPLSHSGRKGVHDRFLEALAATKEYGVNQKLHLKGVSVHRYPGFAKVLKAMLVADGRLSS
jgi:hypothetical protein